jgi:solute carrier family 35 protein E1
MLLTVLFGVWYGTNIMFNVFNKELFSVFKFPITTTCVQFMIGSVISIVLWTVGLVKKPENDPAFFKTIYPLALINVLGNVLTNVSLGLVAVSFTHTVKAAEPFFSVIFSWLFLGDLPPYQARAAQGCITRHMIHTTYDKRHTIISRGFTHRMSPV